MTKQPQQIVDAASGKVDEQILAAAFAKPRGATTAGAGQAIAGEIGAQWAGKHRRGAAAAGIEIGNPGALLLTATSLITASVNVSMTGQIKEITQLLSKVPLADIDSIEVKRVGMAGVMKVASGGSSFKLEGKVPDMRALAEKFDQAKAGS